MTREELSGKLVDIRKSSDTKIVDICCDARMLPRDIARIEKSLHNYNMEKYFAYCNALNCSMSIVYNGISTPILNYDELVEFVKKARQDAGTQKGFAKLIGVSQGVIANIERRSVVMSVDTLLKIINVLKMDIKIDK